MDYLIALFIICMVFGIAFIIWMKSKPGKKWLASL